MTFGKYGLSLKPRVNGDSFAKNPFWIVIKYFDCVDRRVLNKVKIREDISLLNTGLY